MRAAAPALPLCAVAMLAMAAAAPARACDFPGGPPGSEAAVAEGPGVVWAAYSNATDIYRHGVLGDAWEAAALRVLIEGDLAIGPCDDVAWLRGKAVFEDTSPRIADVTGDGLNDVVVVETALDAGAQLAVYGMDAGRFAKLAATPHIGRPHRWLAPAGIADFDGDGVPDVAYVETPHIGGTLRIWSFADGQARELAAARGFSNHRIGETTISGGVRDCGEGPELVLPDDDWAHLQLARLHEGTIEAGILEGGTSEEAIAAALACRHVE